MTLLCSYLSRSYMSRQILLINVPVLVFGKVIFGLSKVGRARTPSCMYIDRHDVTRSAQCCTIRQFFCVRIRILLSL
jgi:hypothetical protein